jgi:hypothetical protein
MATINTKPKAPRTHEGAIASHINAKQTLRRSVMACLLWESQFYEDGVEIATRIETLSKTVDPVKVAAMAVEARTSMKLRHAPLLLAVGLARQHSLRAETLCDIIQRADELAEFLAMYWKDGKCPLSAQVKKGLAKAFTKFDAYQLAKYNRDRSVKLRDVLFLCHAKPKDDEQAAIWKKLVDGTLEAPDTWEVSLSSGGDKKQHWERLLKEKKLGGMALLRNLRNMNEAKVAESLVKDNLAEMKVGRILPFRFIAAARYAPQWEPEIEKALFRCLDEQRRFTGKTLVLVDVSGSMTDRLSAKSDMVRMDAACGVAMCIRELCDDVAVYSFSEHCKRIPSRRGFALRDAIVGSQRHLSTYLGRAVEDTRHEAPDRTIVITDEQSHDRVSGPTGKGYMINVASYQNGVGYGSWTKIDGWSEAILKYIQEYESSLQTQ